MLKRLFGRRPAGSQMVPLEPLTAPVPAVPLWMPQAARDPGPWDPGPDGRFGWRRWVGAALAGGLEEEAHAFARLDLKEARRLADRPEQLLDLLSINAHLSFLQGGLIVATRLAHEAMNIAEAIGSGADVAKALVRIGDIKRRSWQAAEALECYEEALRQNEQALGSEHPHSRGLRDFIASFDVDEPSPNAVQEEEGIQQISTSLGSADLAVLGNHLDMAERGLREALNDAVHMLGRSHPVTVTVLKELATLLGRLGHHQDARKYLLHHADIIGETHGSASDDARAALLLIDENAAAIGAGDDRGRSRNRSIEVVLSPEHLFVWLVDPEVAARTYVAEPDRRADVASSPPSATAARLISGSISADDYPAAALRAEAEGTCVVTFDVSTAGRVENIAVEQSSGHEALDSATSSLISRRFRYHPARNGDGELVVSRVRQSVRWRLPCD